MQKFKVSTRINISPPKLYDAWLSSNEHSAFTGGKATIVPKVGGKITALDGYISGKILALQPCKSITQTWRSSDFSDSDEDSILKVIFEKADKGTKLTLIHVNIPKGQSKGYKQGWKDYYFLPMQKYFT